MHASCKQCFFSEGEEVIRLLERVRGSEGEGAILHYFMFCCVFSAYLCRRRQSERQGGVKCLRQAHKNMLRQDTEIHPLRIFYAHIQNTLSCFNFFSFWISFLLPSPVFPIKQLYRLCLLSQASHLWFFLTPRKLRKQTHILCFGNQH